VEPQAHRGERIHEQEEARIHEQARRQLAADRKRRAEQDAQRAALDLPPTPTQAENDAFMATIYGGDGPEDDEQ
jgi:type IV secretory pathway VirJ component